MDKDYEVMRADLWAKVWIGVANSSNCVRMTACETWADAAVAQFDKRFKEKLTKEPANV